MKSTRFGSSNEQEDASQHGADSLSNTQLLSGSPKHSSPKEELKRGNQKEYDFYKGLSSVMVPKNLVYHSKHQIDLKPTKKLDELPKICKSDINKEGKVKFSKEDLQDFLAATPAAIVKNKCISGLKDRIAPNNLYTSNEIPLFSEEETDKPLSREELSLREYFQKYNEEAKLHKELPPLFLNLK